MCARERWAVSVVRLREVCTSSRPVVIGLGFNPSRAGRGCCCVRLVLVCAWYVGFCLLLFIIIIMDSKLLVCIGEREAGYLITYLCSL